MPFTTDTSWHPSSYRAALAAWQANAPSTESRVMPRQASTSAPRHDALSKQLRSLLTWRATTRGSDWTSIAANDNHAAPALIDSELEIRPRPSEIATMLKGVEFAERRHARHGGGGDVDIVAVGGDMTRGSVEKQRRRKSKEPPLPECVTRLGTLQFSNGAAEESAPVIDAAGKVVRGSVRIPLGGLVRYSGRLPVDRFGAPKGANDNGPAPTVGPSTSASAAAIDFADPVADAQEGIRLRAAIGPQYAAILDAALTASSFSDVGAVLGFEEKAAERKGKAALMEACAALDILLAA